MSENINLLLVFGAGLLSVLSPCVLPVIPVVVTGTGKDHMLRPLLVVSGLSITFILMGVLSSLFGAIVGPAMYFIEKGAGVLIILMGVLMLLDINVFKHLTFLQTAGGRSRGQFGGFILGLLLGVIWIPCVGPMLSSVLTLVATEGTLLHGVIYLAVYAAGFSVPLLLAGYASHLFRNNLSFLKKYPSVIRTVSGGVLVLLGLIIAFKGMVAFGSF
jgi:cytochrome c-type biogenesis protein